MTTAPDILTTPDEDRAACTYGAMVVFLGPDGAGKSTVTNAIANGIGRTVFNGHRYFHLRPSMVHGARGPGQVRDPHGKPPRGLLASILKLGIWWTDYTFGYLCSISPKLKSRTLIIFDRYAHDLLIDQRRYRYGGPVALAKLMCRIVPQPDLWICLDAPAEVIHQRKQDITLEEMRRQRDAYSTFVRGQRNGHIIDASKPVHDVVAQVERVILDFMRNSGRCDAEQRR